MADTNILVLKLKSKEYNRDIDRSTKKTIKLERAQNRLNKTNKKSSKIFKSNTAEVNKLSSSLSKLSRRARSAKKNMRGLNKGGFGLGGGRGNIDGNTAAFARMGASVFGLNSSFLLAAGGIGAAFVALQKLSGFTINAIQLANRQELAEAKLEGALQAKGNMLKFTSNELKRYAFQVSEATGVSDELIINSQGMLATFTNVRGEIYRKTIPAIIDLSKVMNQDLKQSTIQVGKALNNPLKGLVGLRRIGIHFSEEQKKMIRRFMAMNDIAGAQTVILEELNAEMGNTAKLMGETTSGKVDKLDNSFNNLKEGIGDVIKELLLLDPLMKKMNKTTSAMAKGSKNVAGGLKEAPGLVRASILRNIMKKNPIGIISDLLELGKAGQVAQARDIFKEQIMKNITKGLVAGGLKLDQVNPKSDIKPISSPSLVGSARVGSVGAARISRTDTMRLNNQIEENTRRAAKALEDQNKTVKGMPKEARDPVLASPSNGIQATTKSEPKIGWRLRKG